MIIFLSDEHKNHLEILHPLAVPVLIDFCKLSLDFLQNGPNIKKYNMASQKLQVQPTTIENVVHALIYLVIESCKYNLSDNDFRTSLAIAGFSPEHQDILLKFYISKKSDLTEALLKLKEPASIYQDLDWRFEVQIACRTGEKKCEEVKPKVTMDLVMKTPKPLTFDENLESHLDAADSEVNTTSRDLQLHKSNLEVCRTISNARTASECENTIEHVLLECDLPNLLNLTSKLEQALLESKSQHVRKLQRALNCK